MFPSVCCVEAGIKNQPPYRGRRDGFVRTVIAFGRGEFWGKLLGGEGVKTVFGDFVDYEF